MKLLGRETVVEGDITTAVNKHVRPPQNAIGLRAWLEVTRNGADPDETLDVKIQAQSPSGTYFDMPGVAFSQIGAANGNDMILVYPGIEQTANVTISKAISGQMRFAISPGGTTPDYTVALYVEWLG